MKYIFILNERAGKFEYVIEARIFVIGEDIHPSVLAEGEILESQPY